ncbi:MAG TPA: tRNA lysidine(34) synthetase TilS [Thermoanaerobaculia bacterium]|nr:tRNA lysidine(34) synthetase TilS [Thermoanaerobaculia bacterium]
MDLLTGLRNFFAGARCCAPLATGDRLVVAFSGGPDSTALLWGLSRLAAEWRVGLLAAHLDHGMDPSSAERAEQAARLAAALGAPFAHERREMARERRGGEGPEAAARRLRYAFLEQVRRQTRGRYVVTAHHLDDQAETLLLRLGRGTGLAGLAGIRTRHGRGGRVVRPLLELPRAALRSAVTASGLVPVVDPTNADLRRPRNLIRHRLLPHLAAEDAHLVARLGRLARRVQAAAPILERRLAAEIAARPLGAAADLRRLRSLPEALLPPALAALHRRAGAAYPPGRAARAELLRQLRRDGRVGCDCGAGWRWQAQGPLLLLRRAGKERACFTYTLEIPGEVAIPEIAVRIEVSRQAVAPWMFRGDPQRAGLALPVREGELVTIRSRLPGDRLWPLGAPGSRKLKQLLIDRRVPRAERDRLPLLCADGLVAWVPGVAIDERCRLSGLSAASRTTAWVARLISEPAGPAAEATAGGLGIDGPGAWFVSTEGGPCPRQESAPPGEPARGAEL